MARAANQAPASVITEDDGDDGTTREVALNNGVDRVTVPGEPAIKTPARAGADEGLDQFEIVEVDDKGRPLHGADDADDDDGQDRRRDSREANLSEDEDAGDRPLLDQRQRSESRKNRRERQRQGRERTLKENEELKRRVRQLEAEASQTGPRLDRVERRFSQDTANQLETKVKDATTALDQAKKALAAALREGDQDELAAALDKRDQAFVEKLQAEGARDAYKRDTANADDSNADDDRGQDDRQRGRATDRQQQTVRLGREGKRMLDDFMARNEWFDPDGGDEDSQLALFIDRQVRNAGFNPDSQEYWDELEDRLEKRLPHRFEASDDQVDEPRRDERQPQARRQAQNGNGNGQRRNDTPANRRGPMTSGASDQRPEQGQRNQVRIGPDRKKAMMDAGIIQADGTVTDKAKFQRVLKQYADMDRQLAAAQR